MNIPKAICGGKLGPTAVKCRLLGWWVDETKGYRLEDIETQKLITLRDVRFNKDTSLSDLVEIDGLNSDIPMQMVNEPNQAMIGTTEVDNDCTEEENVRV